MISYLNGDATAPKLDGAKIISHICNDGGGWGRGFVLAISKRWKLPEQQYRQWYASGDEFTLGKVQFVKVEADIEVANMIGQHGIRTGRANVAPIRYDAVEKCLAAVAQRAVCTAASIHMPRIGCGLAGGSWEQIEPIIERTLCAHDIAVYVYDFEK